MPRIPKIANDSDDQTPHPSLTAGGGSGTFDGMEARVTKLETEMTDIKVMLGRMDERLTAMNANLASKADIATFASKNDTEALRVNADEITGELRGKLGFWQFLGVVVAILALLVKWPELFRSFGGI